MTVNGMMDAQVTHELVKKSDIDEAAVIGYKSFYNRVAKRGIGFLLALILTICVSPILLIASIAILLEDGMPVLYRAERGGLHGKPFKICKFRSMVKNADKVGGGTTALHDKRITKTGNILRKTKIDEFPNLFNILAGQMSFIGPRPELLKYTNQYEGVEKLILEVRPGITDYSSIEFINLDEVVGSGNADEIYEEKVLPKKNELRIKYAADVSLKTDVKIFLMTVYKVIEKAFGFLFRGKHR